MENIGVGLFFAAVIAVYGAIIWFSVKAKPLAPGPHQKPYRWATYIALTTGLTSFIFITNVPKALDNGNTFAALLGCVLTVFCVSTCVQLMRRKRSGVSFFFATYALIFLAPILLSSAAGSSQTSQPPQHSGFLIYFLISGYYMWKRWHLFNMPTDQTPQCQVVHNQMSQI